MKSFENYFDYAAATPMLPEAVKAMQPYYADNFYNPSALYLGARANRQILESSRHSVAQGLGARPTEIIFTAGGTEANNIALHGIMQAYPGSHLVTTAIEHDAVLEPAKQYNHSIVGVTEKGIVNLSELQKTITDATVLVSVMYVNNEVGAIQPIKEIAEYIAEVKKARRLSGNELPILLHTDACQATNYLDMHVARLGVDMMTVNAGKIYGPKQSGALFVRTGIVLQPLIWGGGQEWNIRSGTENLANIVGFAYAFEKVRSQAHTEAKRLSSIRDTVIKQLETSLPQVIINGPKGNRRLANNIHLTVPGCDNERLLMELDECGFQVATGSACSASNDEPSHVLRAMGIADTDAQSSIRITMGRYTTQESARALADAIKKIIAK